MHALLCMPAQCCAYVLLVRCDDPDWNPIFSQSSKRAIQSVLSSLKSASPTTLSPPAHLSGRAAAPGAGPAGHGQRRGHAGAARQRRQAELRLGRAGRGGAAAAGADTGGAWLHLLLASAPYLVWCTLQAARRSIGGVGKGILPPLVAECRVWHSFLHRALASPICQLRFPSIPTAFP